MKRISAVILTLIILLVAAMPAAAQDQDIVEIASGDDNFSTLVAALQQADLVETLQGDGPFTVFAPTNDAFAKLPEGTLDSLDNETLTKILTYHVVSGSVMAADAIALDGESAATVQGEEIAISVSDGNVMINDATVVTADIQASNGVVHVIDTVLIPPSVAEMMADDSMADEEMAEEMEEDMDEDSDDAAPESLPETGAENTTPWSMLILIAAGFAILGGAYALRTQQS